MFGCVCVVLDRHIWYLHSFYDDHGQNLFLLRRVRTKARKLLVAISARMSFPNRAFKNFHFPALVRRKTGAKGGSLLSLCRRLFALVVMVTAGCSATYIESGYRSVILALILRRQV